MEITLSDNERELLVQLLESEITEVRSEIYHAESHEVKETFKQREATAAVLLEKLSHPLQMKSAA